MENKQITLREIYTELKNLERTLQSKGIIKKSDLPEEDNKIIWDWPEKISILADESVLAEDWLSEEDEEAWKDL